MSFGRIDLENPVRGAWVLPDLPEAIFVGGFPSVFDRTPWAMPHLGVVAHYRERVAYNSAHLFVLENGRFEITHLDEVHPATDLVEHAIRDFDAGDWIKLGLGVGVVVWGVRTISRWLTPTPARRKHVSSATKSRASRANSFQARG